MRGVFQAMTIFLPKGHRPDAGPHNMAAGAPFIKRGARRGAIASLDAPTPRP